MSQPDGTNCIAKLLEKLQTQPDAAKVTLQGKAISRSAENLHLACVTGIVAIPFNEIEDVTPLTSLGDPMLVSVLVNDNSKVRHLMKVQPLTDAPQTGCSPTVDAGTAMEFSARGRVRGGFGGFWLPPIFECHSFTNDYVDTTTASGGVLDQTDDVIPVLQCDDQRA